MRKARRLVETRPTGHGRARGLVSRRTTGRSVEARTFEPAKDLAGVVAALWTGAWELRGQPPHVTELLSDPCVHLVFEEGGAHAGSRLVGVWTRLWRRELAGLGRVRGVKLRAGAVRAFVDAPAHRFTNAITPLGSVFDGDIEELRRRILSPAADEDAFAVFEEWLRQRRRAAEDVSLPVRIVDRIVRDSELTTVDRLAAVTGLGVRALQRLFREHVGASPKWVIRRNRLQEVALRIENGARPSLAALAAELGYTDQAHLTRDFKCAVGRGPSELAAALRGSA